MKLYPFQRQGVHFLVEAERAILADDMGTGKSIQGAIAARCAGVLPVLVVCPNSMKQTWKNEFEKWWPDVKGKVCVVGGSASRRKKDLGSASSIFIINWESLRLHSRLKAYGSMRLDDKERIPGELNREWGVVIADEAHRAKDPKSKQTRSLWAIMESARYRFALTGTPIANSPEDLWSIGHAIAPEDWPSRTKFIDRYCNAFQNYWGGLQVNGLNPATKEEFFRILDPRFLRRTKAEVLPDLPPVVRTQRLVSMDAKQAKAYDSMQRELISEVDGGFLIGVSALAKTTRLLQLAAAMPVIGDDGQVVELAKPSCKVDALMDIVQEAGGAPIVVFAVSRKLIELCAKELEKHHVDYVSITGSVSAADRADSIARFQTGTIPVALVTVGAGGEGITLTAASTAVFLQRPWSMVQNEQAEARIHRIGQSASSVQIIDVVTEGTIEYTVADTLANKLDQLQEIVRDKDRLIALLRGEFWDGDLPPSNTEPSPGT